MAVAPMIAAVLAAGMAVAGWVLLTPVPVAFVLSQVPAAVWVLAWMVDRAAAVDWDRRPIRSHQAAAQDPEPAEVVALPTVASLADHRDRKAA